MSAGRGRRAFIWNDLMNIIEGTLCTPEFVSTRFSFTMDLTYNVAISAPNTAI